MAVKLPTLPFDVVVKPVKLSRLVVLVSYVKVKSGLGENEIFVTASTGVVVLLITVEPTVKIFVILPLEGTIPKFTHLVAGFGGEIWLGDPLKTVESVVVSKICTRCTGAGAAGGGANVAIQLMFEFEVLAGMLIETFGNVPLQPTALPDQPLKVEPLAPAVAVKATVEVARVSKLDTHVAVQLLRLFTKIAVVGDTLPVTVPVPVPDALVVPTTCTVNVVVGTGAKLAVQVAIVPGSVIT